MISIEMFTFNTFQENTYLLFDETGEAVIIDPGMGNASEEKELSDFVEEKNLKVVLVLNTHCHIDHVLGNEYSCRKYQVDLMIPEGEETMLKWAVSFSGVYEVAYTESPEPSGKLKEEDIVEFGNSKLEILFTPGHSPGHIVFINRLQHFVIGGDVLFKDSVGRMDLPGGDGPTLLKSIREKLFTLGDDYQVYPGHGPSTLIGYERINNPFAGESAASMF